jgi:pantoate--beta-alanine ligase
MIITNSTEHLKQLLSIVRKNKTIGFVPTMGALHQGHMSLVKASMEQYDFTVVSVFVNPNQFDDINDFRKYPRTPEADISLLADFGTNLVFIPSEKEIYPNPDTRVFDFGTMDKGMEGEFRPGHFNGMAQVVSRLFEIVKPEGAFFGEKDFQQLAIIKMMVEQLNLSVEVIPCPIVREYDGLAMSSRNRLLTNEQRAHVPLIAQTLFEAKEKRKNTDVKELQKWVKDTINKNPELEVEYVEIVNARTLQPVTKWSDAAYVQLCVAVYVRPVRLIDNIRLK